MEQRYELVDELGRGGMGKVLAGRDPHLGRTVAVKVLLQEAWKNEETRTRFLREAQLTAQLEHPNILPVYALEKSAEGPPAFSMKLVRGSTFEDLITECREAMEAGRTLRGDLSLEGRLELFLRVCDAIAYAHDRGVVHRDLKPENLMLGAFGEVYVVDWGIAKVMGEAENAPERLEEIPDGLTTATQAGYAVGTPAYMSPEQAAGEIEELGPASDQYALGLILQELITLQRANDTGQMSSTLARAIKAERAPLVPLKGKVHPDMKAIVTKATQLEIEDRYPSVSAFADDVRAFIQKEETVARPDRLWRKPVRWTLRHPALATSMGLAVALLGMFAVTTVTVAGVVGLAVSQAAAHERERALTALVMSVADHAHEVDTRFLSYEALLERLGAATVHLLEHGEPAPAPVYTLPDLLEGRGPDDFAQVDLYDQGVTLQSPVVVLAPGVTREQVEADLFRLAPLVAELRGAVLRSHGPEAIDLGEDAARALILEEGVPVGWSYVGLENGALINYPGNTRYSPDYDPRARPWYIEAHGTRGPVWGEPYPDDSGMGVLLPCNLALYDGAGSFLGVASIGVVLRQTAQGIAPDDIPGLRRVSLVDDRGRVVVASDQEGLDLWVGLNEDQALELEPFPVAEVRDALADASSGHVAVGDAIYVWSRMDALGWTYVAEVDAGTALKGP